MGQPARSFRLNPLHRLWRLLPAQRRRQALARLTALLAPHPTAPPAQPAQGLAVAGELSRASGLGEVARLMLRGAERLGLSAWPLDIGPLVGGSDMESFASAGTPPPGTPLVLHVNAPMLPMALMRLGRAKIRGRRVIGYWSWELPVVSPDWHAGVPFVHEVWAPSAFTAAALEPLLPGRVRIVRPPLAEAPPTPAHLGRMDFGLPDDAVVVTVAFNLASSFERKNPIAAVRAFQAAFGDRRDRLLLLKVGNPDHFPADFQRLEAAIAGLGNVRIETRVFPPADHFALLAASDIVLSLHRSEGLGLVPAEAMLLRKPVVATGWSGNMDFMDEDSAALVPFRMKPPNDPRGVLQAEGALWADPDVDAAAACLRRLADDPAARAGLGESGYRMAVSRFGLGSLAEALRGIGLQVNEGG